MHTGEELGRAIREAIDRKGVTQGEVAIAFGVRQSSVSEWLKFGRISKKHLPRLFDYFDDVVGRDHWGLSLQASGEMVTDPHEAALLAAFRAIAGDPVAAARALAYVEGLAAASADSLGGASTLGGSQSQEQKRAA